MAELLRKKGVEGNRHWWAVVGDLGGVHFWYQVSTFDGEKYGGVEWHWRKPTEDYHAENPDHNDCWIIGGPCWHDGTSLYAEEVYIPLVDHSSDDTIFLFLEGDYAKLKKPEAEGKHGGE